MSRLRAVGPVAAWGAWLILAGLGWLLAASPARRPAPTCRRRAPRRGRGHRDPAAVQLALDAAGRLVVLSHGWRGDAAAEIYRIDLRGPLPVDARGRPGS